MARIRYIKPEFFDSEQVASVSLAARLLFAGLWTVADREGRFELAPRRLKARLLPYDDVSVEPLLDELIASELVLAYRVDGTLYGWMPGFVKHQRPHPNEAKSTIPPCPPDGKLPSASWNLTSRNGSTVQPRGERNGDGEGTEREGTAPVPVVSPLDPAPVQAGAAEPVPERPWHPSRPRHGNAFGFRRDASAAWEGPLFNVPAKWFEKVRQQTAGKFSDVVLRDFATTLTARVQRTGEEVPIDGFLGWLDREASVWLRTRQSDRTGDAAAKATDAFIRQQDEIAATIPKRTPEEVAALMGRPKRTTEPVS